MDKPLQNIIAIAQKFYSTKTTSLIIGTRQNNRANSAIQNTTPIKHVAAAKHIVHNTY